MKTTKITLSWKSPEPGRATITFPATDSAEIEGLHQYLRAIHDTDYGDTVPRITQKEGEGNPKTNAWGRLASTLRYDTGEGVYTSDIETFKSRGIVRCDD